MPLDRASVTRASRIMLPTYVIFFGVVGVNLLVAPTARLAATPMFAYADTLLDLRVWGGLFTAAGLLMLVALLAHHRTLYRYGLLLCGLSMGLWALVALVGAFSTATSYSAWAYPAFVCAACTATNRSLVRREGVQPLGSGG